MANNKFYNALNQISQSTPPIWFMRQAGRYHSHYQQLKLKYTFEELCKNAELAAEVACGPVEEFDFDVAILFSDILFVLEGLGLELEFNPGPIFKEELNLKNYKKFNDIDRAIDHMTFQSDAIKFTRQKLAKNKSLIGFVGGLWTILRFATGQNKEKKNFQNFYIDFMETTLLEVIKKNIKLQLDAGAEVVMMFDSGISSLDNDFFRGKYKLLLKNISNSFPNKVGYYARGKNYSEISYLSDLPFAGLGVDSDVELKHIFLNSKFGFVQGNFNENYLLLDSKELENKLHIFSENMKNIGNLNGWVCGLGHGINKTTPEKNVHLFIETIRKKFS
jgi:uroporphyrinogen decarboxylase